jgi:hypothetical protein
MPQSTRKNGRNRGLRVSFKRPIRETAPMIVSDQPFQNVVEQQRKKSMIRKLQSMKRKKRNETKNMKNRLQKNKNNARTKRNLNRQEKLARRETRRQEREVRRADLRQAREERRRRRLLEKEERDALRRAMRQDKKERRLQRLAEKNQLQEKTQGNIAKQLQEKERNTMLATNIPLNKPIVASSFAPSSFTTAAPVVPK